MVGLTGASVTNIRPVVDHSQELYQRIRPSQLVHYMYANLHDNLCITNVKSYPTYSNDEITMIPSQEAVVIEKNPLKQELNMHTAASLARATPKSTLPGNSSRSTPVVRLNSGSGRSETPKSRINITQTLTNQQSTPKLDSSNPPFPVDHGVLLLDVRNIEEFNKSHILGSIHYPILHITRDQISTLLYQYKSNEKRHVIIIGDMDVIKGTTTHLYAEQACNALLERGWERVFLLHGGINLFRTRYPHWLVSSLGHVPPLALQQAPHATQTFTQQTRYTPKTQELLQSRDSTQSLYKASFAGYTTDRALPYGNKSSANQSHIQLTDQVEHTDMRYTSAGTTYNTPRQASQL